MATFDVTGTDKPQGYDLEAFTRVFTVPNTAAIGDTMQVMKLQRGWVVIEIFVDSENVTVPSDFALGIDGDDDYFSGGYGSYAESGGAHLSHSLSSGINLTGTSPNPRHRGVTIAADTNMTMTIGGGSGSPMRGDLRVTLVFFRSYT